MFTFTGFIASLWAWLILIGVAIVEAAILMLTFNYLAPQFIEIGIMLPIISLTYWTSFSLILFVTVVGKMIQKLVPTFVKINNSKK